MNRRSFLKTSLATTTAASVFALPQVSSADHHEGRRYLELRRMVIKSKEKRDSVTHFLKTAAVPALNRAGIKPVGLFHELPEANDHSITLLLPFNSLQQFGSWEARLAADREFTDRGADYLGADKSDPAYERIESTLMEAFEAYPEVKVPRTGKRVFELRVYESHSELKGMLKVEMFNRAELDIFEKVGLDGVFYGRSVSGPSAVITCSKMHAYM